MAREFTIRTDEDEVTTGLLTNALELRENLQELVDWVIAVIPELASPTDRFMMNQTVQRSLEIINESMKDPERIVVRDTDDWADCPVLYQDIAIIDNGTAVRRYKDRHEARADVIKWADENTRGRWLDGNTAPPTTMQGEEKHEAEQEAGR